MEPDCKTSPGDEVVLRIDNISFQAGDQAIVEGISADIHHGDFLAIVGPSGAGKSTLLRLINRLDEPTGGHVYLDGQDTYDIPPCELRRRVGMVMQSAYLFPGTVADNIKYGPQQRGEDVSPETIESLLASVNLPGYADRDVANLSGGEAQRVSLARTLANAPQVLLLDEPTSALDDAARIDVEKLICRIAAEQRLTCLIVTHDTDQAARMANRVMMLDGGRMVRIGKPEELLQGKR
jgi:putative ABC transport system ATP-binding protein